MIKKEGIQLTPLQKDFKDSFTKNLPDLELFTAAITRAHGKRHTEVFDVRELFLSLKEKIKKSPHDTIALEEDFKQLRTITNHYEVPSDGCETFAATYQLLSQLDDMYQQTLSS